MWCHCGNAYIIWGRPQWDDDATVRFRHPPGGGAWLLPVLRLIWHGCQTIVLYLSLDCFAPSWHSHKDKKVPVVSENKTKQNKHDDVIKWKHLPRYWRFVRGIHRWPVNSPHKGQWRGNLMFSLICAWRNAWVNHRYAGDLRRHCAHHDVTVMVVIPNAHKLTMHYGIHRMHWSCRYLQNYIQISHYPNQG